jgi:formylglycine-generating enzyme required for sulfatase activity
VKTIASALAIALAAAALAAPAAGAADRTADPGIELVSVPGGCFTMGDDGAAFDARPAHEVCVGAFSIGRTEVTQEQFTRVMGENPSTASCPTCPVDGVSWEQAQAFLRKAGQLTGKRYRLPTEAEWEYACRGGGKAQRYCGGDAAEAVAWDVDGGGPLHPVGQKKPNAFGLHDMSGNADEWVADWYGEVFYWVSPRQDPVGPSASWTVLEDDEPYRVVRGRGLATSRGWVGPSAVGERSGFRVALDGPRSGPKPRPVPGKPGPAQGVDVLPRGGGAPGEAFQRWEKARADDLNHALATLSKRALVEKLVAMADEEAGRKGEPLKLTDAQVEAFYESVKRHPPMTSDTRIASGIARGDLAILFSERQPTESGFSQTLVYMDRRGGAWTVRRQLSRFHAAATEVH